MASMAEIAGNVGASSDVMAETRNPVLVEVTRGERVESRHCGAAAVVLSDGTVVAAWGNVDAPVFARSAIKPIQALPLIETGAADHFGVTEEELALACASHGGEAIHVDRVYAWLARLGLSAGDLLCGAHAPMTPAAADALARRGTTPTALHNNCSGKHAGFLTTALHLREPTVGYAGSVHPVQLRVKQVLTQLTGARFDTGDVATDGCGVPTFAVPVRRLAHAMARLADPGSLGRLRTEAVSRVVAAMTSQPHLVGGEGRFDTRVMAAAGGTLVTKGGAEAVHVAALTGRGVGIALKIDDGAKRASECALAVLLARYGEAAPNLLDTLAAYREAPVRNAAGSRVGTIRTARDWPA